jgi:hypothetical protein
MTASAGDILTVIVLSGIFGMVGQLIRVIAGLKKLADMSNAPATAQASVPADGQASAPANAQTNDANVFQTSTLVVSLLIGFVAGVVALLATQGIDNPVAYNTKLALAIMAAGYAGTDFIEAFMRKYLPSR